MKDKVNGTKTFVGKREFKKGAFICFTFINANMCEKYVMGITHDDCGKLVLILFSDLQEGFLYRSCTRNS